jgi:microcystin-dependent protein
VAGEPQTVNAGLVVPLTGDLSGTWGSVATNPDFVALDGYLCGVQAISVSNVPVTLTKPTQTDGSTYNPTPGPGPTQAQNRVLRFTGVLTANVRVTLPLPGVYEIENLTTGNFVLSFQGVTATEVVGTPQGEIVHIYNDGANVRFVSLARMGVMEHWVGISAMPAWVTACTKQPYLPCDNVTTYNFSDYPYLGARLGGTFGGNGVTTFKTPDMGGRVPLAYDYTGSRITAAGCGINGQTIGASQDKQTNTLGTTNLPPYTPSGSVAMTTGSGGTNPVAVPQGQTPTTLANGANTNVYSSGVFFNLIATFTGSAQGGMSVPVNNVQPAQVTGIWVIKAA